MNIVIRPIRDALVVIKFLCDRNAKEQDIAAFKTRRRVYSDILSDLALSGDSTSDSRVAE